MYAVFKLHRFLIQRNLLGKHILCPANKVAVIRMVNTTIPKDATMMPCAKQIGAPSRVRDNPAFKKIDTPEFHGIFTPELRTLIEIFKKYNYEIRVAGGAVRDILMHKAPKDIDLATTATPEQMKAMFTQEAVRMINAKGEKHGTITPRINNKENFEVTTLRIDVRTDGRHAEVQFTTDWQLDANRRDLTINSMFLGFDGTLYDYFFGYEDLQQRRVIFVGSADVRIKEDYLRILRYFRFYGRIAEEPNNHDEVTLQAVRNNVRGLAQISGERVWAEMHKIVVGNFARDLVVEMINCGIAPFCGLPIKPNLAEYERYCKILVDFEKPHYPILSMIALLNTCEDAVKLHERLKLSAFERDMALFITQHRDGVDKEYTTLRDYQRLCLKCLQPMSKREFVEQLLKYCGKVELYHALKSWKLPTYPLNGNVLQDHGCPRDKKMGIVNNELKSIWINSDFKLTANELLEQHLPEVLEKVVNNSPNSTPRKKLKSK